MGGRVLERGVRVARIAMQIDEARVGVPSAEDVDLREVARGLLAVAALAAGLHPEPQQRIEERAHAAVGRRKSTRERSARDALRRGVGHSIEKMGDLARARRRGGRRLGRQKVQKTRLEVDREVRMEVEHPRQQRRPGAPDPEDEHGTHGAVSSMVVARRREAGRAFSTQFSGTRQSLAANDSAVPTKSPTS
jgi:hypothetical protein